MYRNLGASATGDVVFGYTGAESYCKSCRNGFGDIQIDEARFTVWNRRSGQVVARSPKLEAERAPCMLVQIGASCDEDEHVPELQMSANGKAVLAFWTGRFPPRDDGAEASKLEVYRLP